MTIYSFHDLPVSFSPLWTFRRIWLSYSYGGDLLVMENYRIDLNNTEKYITDVDHIYHPFSCCFCYQGCIYFFFLCPFCCLLPKNYNFWYSFVFLYLLSPFQIFATRGCQCMTFALLWLPFSLSTAFCYLIRIILDAMYLFKSFINV